MTAQIPTANRQRPFSRVKSRVSVMLRVTSLFSSGCGTLCCKPNVFEIPQGEGARRVLGSPVPPLKGLGSLDIRNAGLKARSSTQSPLFHLNAPYRHMEVPPLKGLDHLSPRCGNPCGKPNVFEIPRGRGRCGCRSPTPRASRGRLCTCAGQRPAPTRLNARC